MFWVLGLWIGGDGGVSSKLSLLSDFINLLSRIGALGGGIGGLGGLFRVVCSRWTGLTDRSIARSAGEAEGIGGGGAVGRGGSESFCLPAACKNTVVLFSTGTAPLSVAFSVT